MSEKMVIPQKLGLKTDPPCLLLVYEFWGKTRLRRFPLRHVSNSTSTEFVLDDLRARHDVLKSIPDEKIGRMIDIIKAVKDGSTLEEAVKRFKEDDQREPASPIVRINDENVTKRPAKEEIIKHFPPVKPDKKLFEDDTDFDLHDDLPLDDLDDDDFWK